MEFDLSCPMPHAKVKWDDDGNERVGLDHMPCGESLYLTYETSTDLLNSTVFALASPTRVEDNAAQTWKVECPNGHVLLSPADDGSDEVDDVFGPLDAARLAIVMKQLGGRVE